MSAFRTAHRVIYVIGCREKQWWWLKTVGQSMLQFRSHDAQKLNILSTRLASYLVAVFLNWVHLSIFNASVVQWVRLALSWIMIIHSIYHPMQAGIGWVGIDSNRLNRLIYYSDPLILIRLVETVGVINVTVNFG